MSDDDSRQFVRIALLENPIEAQILADALESAEIPHRVRSYHDTAYDGLFQVQKGWGEISAPERFRDEILEMLGEVRQGAQTPESP